VDAIQVSFLRLDFWSNIKKAYLCKISFFALSLLKETANHGMELK
jgi:hypothetical protein